jgi:hypothetical protein
VSALGDAVVLVVAGVVVVVVDAGVVVVVDGVAVVVVDEGVVDVDPDEGVDDVGGGVEEEDVEVVELPLDEDEDVVVLSDVEGLVLEEVVSRPLLCSCVSISC